MTQNDAYGKKSDSAHEKNVENYIEQRREPKSEFAIGTKVRIQVQKGKFDKGYSQRWSDEIFIVETVVQTNPTTYKLRDVKGEIIQSSRYKQELKKG